MKKDKAKKKTTKEYCEEFKREMEELSPFEDEKVVKSSKKKKETIKRNDLEEQDARREKKKMKEA